METDSGAAGPEASIRRAALELGFSSVGIAPADPPAHAEHYLEWLDAGRHADMGWMAREDAVRRRLDPTEALPGCRSLVLVTLSYAPSAPLSIRSAQDEGPIPLRSFDAPPDTAPGRDATDAVISRYALGRDYHAVFEHGLAGLEERIRSLGPAIDCKSYVDYGPVLERDHAQRAGLGWIGKNTLLIDPRLGSYFLIGEVLTTLDLEPDAAFLPDRCGSCSRCIDACPTDAIVSERVLDARRCISWLTIENRGPIPPDLRAAIGNRVFGCDICQEVCPWNRDPAGGSGASLELGRPVAPESLAAWAEELLLLDDESFRSRYAGTALLRPGRDALLRNLCVGLGNCGSDSARPVLERCAADRSLLVREHARWGLSRL